MGKKYLVLISIAAVLLTSCSPGSTEEEAGGLDDFVIHVGSSMTAAPDGYYILLNGFLYYVTADFSDSTVVCDKINCIHNDKKIENKMEYFECGAYYGLGNLQVDYYDGFLYIVGNNPNTIDGLALYQVSADGTERTMIYECKGPDVLGLTVWDGTAYIGEKTYSSNGAVHSVTAVPLEHPENAGTLYETEDYPERTMNQMKCRDRYCYFYLYDSRVENEEAVYMRINLKTGEAETLCEPSSCRIEVGADWYMVYRKNNLSYDPAKWTEEYYFMSQETGELTKLTEADFSSIGERDMLRNMDDRYIYFISINYGADKVPQEKQKIMVYDYEGNPAAQISASEFGNMYYVLPGTDDYMFIQTVTGLADVPYQYYYVDKSEFDGGTVEAHLIRIGETG